MTGTTKGQVRPALLENILAQADAIRAVGNYQFGPGLTALIRCAEMLRSSKRIVLTGMGASLFSAIPLSYLLGERGVAAPAMESSELLHFLSPMLDSDTAVVLISRSGESVEITKLLPVLKSRGCRVLGVVNVRESKLAREAGQALLVNSPADELVAIQTYSGTLASLALLGAAYFDELEQAKEELEQTVEAIASLLSGCAASGDIWPDVPECGAPLYLLGRGTALASVRAGELLMHEVAKMPAVGMSSAQFRHGPVEVVSDRFRAIVFTCERRTAKLDVALAEDLIRIGGDVRRVGPFGGESKVKPLCAWPEDVPSRFASILEIVPVQLLAYQMARSRGVPSGRFRFAPAVTMSETGFSV